MFLSNFSCHSNGLPVFLRNRAFFGDTGVPTLGSRGFSCALSGFGQVLKSDPREKLFLAASPLVSRPSAEDVSAYGKDKCSHR